MSGDLQYAIQLVKDGHHAKAQSILAEIISVEPKDEQAWLWLAAVLNEDNRQYCLRQVLIINPNNQQARLAVDDNGLDSYAQSVDSKDFPMLGDDSLDSTIEGQVSEQNARVDADLSESVTSKPAHLDFWVYSQGKTVRAIILNTDKVTNATLEPKMRRQFVERLGNDELPLDSLVGMEQISFDKIIEIFHYKNHVQILHENPKKQKLDLNCVDQAMGSSILNALSRKLGPRFERRTESKRFNAQMVALFILFILVAAITAVMFFGTIEIATGNVSLPLDARTVSAVSAIGPIGVLGIGMVTMLVLFVSMIYRYMRPPKTTKLILDASI